jgi:pyruvate/oxaloacetate carboxyltransferase
LCYSLTEAELGGALDDADYCDNKALMNQGIGANSPCRSYIAGVVAPGNAHDLTTALEKAVRIPADLHSHFTSVMAAMSYFEAIEARANAGNTIATIA